ncbi:MAG: hypothetical protein ACRDGV_09815 [Candidatus Limnocylindria bacterium]
MPKGPAKTTDDIADTIGSVIDRMVDAKFTREMARRGQEMAALVAERGADVGDYASETWRDTRPLRRDAAKRMSRASKEAATWSERTWKKSLRPAVRDLWKQRTLAIGAAGAAVPAARELGETAAARLGIRQREHRHWGAFFLGLLIGAAAGAIIAMLTTPKPGRQMRHELGEKAGELGTRARDAEWVPLFQREGQGEGVDGHGAEASDAIQEAAAESGTAAGQAAERAADETADAINEAYDSVERDQKT